MCACSGACVVRAADSGFAAVIVGVINFLDYRVTCIAFGDDVDDDVLMHYDVYRVKGFRDCI